MTLRERALNLLAWREHSRAELARKLAAHGKADEIQFLLDTLEREGLLSETRYVEAQARAHAGRHGSLRLKQTLQRQGVGGELLEATLAQARALDYAACKALWQRKYGRHAADDKEKARQYRFLQSRGFPSEVVARVLAGKDAD
ncbi:MAG: recombination regulator RecX [Thiobacillaceae bacterium]